MEFFLSLPRADPAQREYMIEKQLKERGIRTQELLKTMLEIPRELFVPSKYFHGAYEDVAIPLGYQRYSCPPYVVALMTEAAEVSPSDCVLDIGTGCGYPAAVLSRLCQRVFTVEPVEELYEDATDRLRDLGFANVSVLYAEPGHGCPQRAPFDAIFVRDALSLDVLAALTAQLAVNGRLLAPLRREGEEEVLVRVTRLGENSFLEELVLPHPDAVRGVVWEHCEDL